MKKLNLIIFLAILFLYSCRNDIPISLTNTKWSSQYYFYASHYQFINDSIVLIESGQLVGTMPIDQSLLSEEEQNEYGYGEADTFNYQLVDSTLFITLVNHESEPLVDTFIYDPVRKHWVGTIMMTYGQEHLIQGEKILSYPF